MILTLKASATKKDVADVLAKIENWDYSSCLARAEKT